MRQQIKAWREEMAQLATEARSKLDEIKDDTSAEQRADLEKQHDEAMDKYDAVKVKADRAERSYEATREVEERAERDAREGRPNGPSGEARGNGEGDPPKKGAVLIKFFGHGFNALDNRERECLAEMRAADDSIPLEVRAQASGTDAAGGYTIPTEFLPEIDKQLAMWGPMMDDSAIGPRMLDTDNGRELEMPKVNDTAAVADEYAENAASLDDGSKDVVFGGQALRAYPYNTGVVRIPIYLMQDSAFGMEALIEELFGERMGRTLNAVLTTGDGADKPQGLFPAAGVGHNAVSNAAIASDELFDLFHSVDPAYRVDPSCSWQFNDATLKSIRKLKDGDGNYLWQMGDVSRGEPPRLLDKPYSINQAAPDIGASARSIVFGAMKKFMVRRVRTTQMLALRERYAEFLQVGMIAHRRIDSELRTNAAVKALVHPA